jgi:hypothetical protein
MDGGDGPALGGLDLALLSFHVPEGPEVPSLAFSLELRKMDLVGAWGYPGRVIGLDRRSSSWQGDQGGFSPVPAVYTEGAVSTFLEFGNGRGIVHTAAVSGGSSGGPLINSRGEVVGMNCWLIGDGAGLAVAQPSERIVRFLAINGLKVRLSGEQAPGLLGFPKASPGAGFKDLGSFTLRVPTGWSVESEDKDYIRLRSGGLPSEVTMAKIDSSGLTARKWAQLLAMAIGLDERDRAKGLEDAIVYRGDCGGRDCSLAVQGDLDGGKVEYFLMVGDLSDPGIGELARSVADK